MAQEDVRQYDVQARSSDVFGRVLCNARNQHFIVDGPVQNGCPGEAITPAEIFLAGVASCGVELIQVLAKQEQAPLRHVEVKISGMMDRTKPAHPHFTLFNSVTLRFTLTGVTQEQGAELIEAFKGR